MTRVINLWLWLLTVIPFLTVKSEVEVTFTSTPDPPTVAEGNTAVFNCSSNHSLVTISWLLNRTVSASTLTSLGVIVNGVGTPASSLFIPGLVDPFNDTEVQCVAFGYNVGNFSPPSVKLRVQGVLSEVGNLSCKQTNDDCIECNWEAPFSRTIQHYVVNIDIANIEKTETLNYNSTTAIYCPTQYCQQYGLYNISVAAVTDLGAAGMFSSEIVDLRPGTWENVHILNSSTRQGQWNFTFTASTTSFLAGGYNIIAHFNDTTKASGNAKVNHQRQVSGTIETGKIDERKWNMSISLDYGTSNILISEPVEINTFGVQDCNITVEDFKICVEVEFIDRSGTMECLAEYKCSRGHSHGTITITRENPRVCTKEVKPSNYTVTLYVGCFNEPDKIFAVLDIIVMETISVIMPPSSFGLPSSTTPADADGASFSTGLVIAAVLVLICIILLIIVIGIIIAFFSTKKNRLEIGKASKKKHEHADKEVKLGNFSLMGSVC